IDVDVAAASERENVRGRVVAVAKPRARRLEGVGKGPGRGIVLTHSRFMPTCMAGTSRRSSASRHNCVRRRRVERVEGTGFRDPSLLNQFMNVASAWKKEMRQVSSAR